MRVHILYYATKGTFDTYRCQMLEKKRQIAAKILSAKPISRTCEGIDETALTFAEMKAAATGGGLMAHEVGAGKTAASAGLGMYLKSVGAINKPMYVVPNAVIGAVRREISGVFSEANILVVTEKDFQKESRQKFLSKISSGNFDAVIISQSQFEKLPLLLERQEEFYEKKIDAFTSAIESIKSEQGNCLSVKSSKACENRLK